MGICAVWEMFYEPKGNQLKYSAVVELAPVFLKKFVTG